MLRMQDPGVSRIFGTHNLGPNGLTWGDEIGYDNIWGVASFLWVSHISKGGTAAFPNFWDFLHCAHTVSVI